MDSYTCKKCGAFYREKIEALGHVCPVKTPVVPVVEPAPVIAPATPVDPVTKKHTPEEIQAMGKQQLIDILKGMGVDKLEGKYLAQCKVSELEAAILEAK